MDGKIALLTMMSGVAALQAASAQTPSAPPAPRDADGYARHVALATDAAKSLTSGVAGNALKLCEIPLPARVRVPRERASAPPAVKAFDNLYFVGLAGVSAWALKTSDGIILIDSLNSAADAQNTIVPGLRSLGLDPAQIRYVIVTHQHGDHFGGAGYLAATYGARVIASDQDWKGMEAMTPNPANPRYTPPPKRDITITDGEKLTLGDTTVTLYVTPGHTPGSISLLIPVKDEGRPHVAMLWGGTGLSGVRSRAQLVQYDSSSLRFRSLVAAAKADIVLSNHGFVDDSTVNLPVLAKRAPGTANPFIRTPQSTQAFLTVMSECARAREAAFRGPA